MTSLSPIFPTELDSAHTFGKLYSSSISTKGSSCSGDSDLLPIILPITCPLYCLVPTPSPLLVESFVFSRFFYLYKTLLTRSGECDSLSPYSRSSFLSARAAPLLDDKVNTASRSASNSSKVYLSRRSRFRPVCIFHPVWCEWERERADLAREREEEKRQQTRLLSLPIISAHFFWLRWLTDHDNDHSMDDKMALYV